ncbi:MAG: LysR substrate-binding domain-containing protein [Gammaproteobacteria bacterium]
MTRLRRRLPPLSTLVAFEAAFRLRSFTRAADELALSQASVSRQVRQLELNLGLRLFERRRYDVVPTADGETLAATVRLSLNELASTAERLRKRGSGTESLTIFSDITIAGTLIAAHLGEFQRRHPDLRVRVLASSEPIEAVNEDFDIGFQSGRWAEDRFTIEALADDVIFPVCSPQLAARLPSPIVPVEIAKQPLLHLVDPGRKWPDWRSFLAFFRLKEPAPIEGLVFNSYQICLDVAEKGEGMALGWARSVKERLDAGELVRIPGMTMPLPNSINAYRALRAPPNPIADRFVELLRSKIEPVD